MPEDFMNCVKNGGRVVTKNLKDDKYIKICYDKEGNSYSGEVKKKQKQTANNNFNKERYRQQKQIDDSKIMAKKLLELRDIVHEKYHN